jgi:ketosteroid isomerase-like protein
MTTGNSQLLKKISEEFAKGNLQFCSDYLASGIKWSILGSNPIIGKEEVLETSKMLQLESFPVVTIKNVVAEGNCVVVESIGEARTKNGKPYNQTYCDVFRFNGEQLQEITTYLDTALSNEVLKEY